MDVRTLYLPTAEYRIKRDKKIATFLTADRYFESELESTAFFDSYKILASTLLPR